MDIAVDGDSIYWTTFGPSLSAGFVMKMPLAGGIPTALTWVGRADHAL